MLGMELFDAQTGEKLGKIDRVLATIRIEDLYALNLRRNINLQELKIEGLEAWVTFDEQGRSNFRNLHIPPPEPNRRILFAYSTARLVIQSSVIHYGDKRHEISGEARNIQATIQPDDPAAPAESWMNTVTLALTNSTFTYDGRAINDISVNARGRVNQTRADIHELIVRTPIGEAKLDGTMDDWRALRYQMNITSTVDLTQASEVLHPQTTLRGVGNFSGKVSGEGDQYKVDGALNLTRGRGWSRLQGERYGCRLGTGQVTTSRSRSCRLLAPATSLNSSNGRWLWNRFRLSLGCELRAAAERS